ncbi:MAG: hypothetical protein GMKNLPBB_01498 [Myxococcota bacterium]|nr:hypothetical protein [Myxococcota bacterium]
MKQILMLSIRNITRNKKRTAITLTAVFMGIFVIVLVRGLLSGLHSSFITNITENMTGDLQIQRAGYLEATESIPLKLNIELNPAFEQALKSAPEVRGWAPRIRFGGLISNGKDSAMFIGMAADPAREMQVTPKVAEQVIEGRYLEPADPNGVLLSKELGNSLNLKIGDEVTILANSLEGAMNGRDLVVRGFLKSSLPNAPRKILIMNIAAAREMLFMEGRATEVTLDLTSPEAGDTRREAITAALKTSGQDLKVYSWRELTPFFVDIMSLQNFIFNIIIAVLFLMVLTGIANTMLMTVFERTREIGAMMALGMRRATIIRLFLSEALVIGIIGAAAGIFAGSSVVLWLGRRGIEFTVPGTNFPLLVHPKLVPIVFVYAVVFAIACSLISAAYPTWRAGKLTPVEALRG